MNESVGYKSFIRDEAVKAKILELDSPQLIWKNQIVTINVLYVTFVRYVTANNPLGRPLYDYVTNGYDGPIVNPQVKQDKA